MAEETVVRKALKEAFREAYHRDHANSAIHCSEVQFRPLTISLASALVEDGNGTAPGEVWEALRWERPGS